MVAHDILLCMLRQDQHSSFRRLPGRGGGRESEGSAPDLAAVCPGESFGVGDAGAAFPMLQQLVEAEAGGAQGGGGLAGEGGGKGEDDRLLALIFEAGLAGEGAAAESGPAANLLRIAPSRSKTSTTAIAPQFTY